LSRAFYARRETKIPVTMSIIDVVITLTLEAIFVLVFHLPIWSIALANTLGVVIQVISLYVVLGKKLNMGLFAPIASTFRSLLFALSASFVMFTTLKVFDKSVWVKSLSFIGSSAVVRNLNFENFVLDTRYTVNLIILSGFVGLLGLGIYLFLSWIVRAQELYAFARLLTRKKEPLNIPTESVTEIEPEG